MRAILTRNRLMFTWLVALRNFVGVERVIIRDNASYVADGDWELWQDEGECIG